MLFLILAFFNAAGLFVLLGAEFLAMILVVVYVGAVMVLFLFVVMMLDVDFAVLRAGFLKYLPIGATIGIVLLVELILVLGAWVTAPEITAQAPTPPPSQMSNTEALGQILYTKYVYLFEAAGLILLVAMIGAIVLTLQHKRDVKRQSVARASGTHPRERRSKWSRSRRGGASHDHRPLPLSHRRRDPVHARHFRHLPQSQERDRHSDERSS